MTLSADKVFSTRLPEDMIEKVREHADQLDRSTAWVLRQALTDYFEGREIYAPREEDDGELVKVEARHGGQDRLVVEGYEVPFVTVTKHDEDGEEKYGLVLDGRFGVFAPYEEFWRWSWFLANAMAVAAGYTSHGRNARRMNPHGEPEPLPDGLRSWAEAGWRAHEERGALGRTLELTLNFRWPFMGDADERAYELRDRLIAAVSDAGAKDIVTRLISLGPLQAETSISEPDEGYTVGSVVQTFVFGEADGPAADDPVVMATTIKPGDNLWTVAGWRGVVRTDLLELERHGPVVKVELLHGEGYPYPDYVLLFEKQAARVRRETVDPVDEVPAGFQCSRCALSIAEPKTEGPCWLNGVLRAWHQDVLVAEEVLDEGVDIPHSWECQYVSHGLPCNCGVTTPIT